MGSHSNAILDLNAIPRSKIFGYKDLIEKKNLFNLKLIEKDLDDIFSYNKSLKILLGLSFYNSKSRLKLKKITKGLPNDRFSDPIIHNSAIISKKSKIGNGTVIFPNVVIGNNVIVEDGCVINTGSIIEHDTIIGKFTHVAPGVTICGNVFIGEWCLIGAGSNIINSVSIKANTIIKAGTTILKNL